MTSWGSFLPELPCKLISVKYNSPTPVAVIPMVVICLGFQLDITPWMSSIWGKTMPCYLTWSKEKYKLVWSGESKEVKTSAHFRAGNCHSGQMNSVTIHKITANTYQCCAKLHSLTSSFGSLLVGTVNLQVALKGWGNIFWNGSRSDLTQSLTQSLVRK